MAEPKKKRSRTRTSRARAAFKADIPALVVCGHCGAQIPAHTVCPHCGYYKNEKVA